MSRKNARWVDGKIRCSKCRTIKPTTDFYKNKSRKDGYAGHCKLCEKMYAPRKRTRKGQQNTKRGKQLRVPFENPKQAWAENIRNTYEADAKKRKRKFLLTLSEVTRMIFQPCEYCGGFSDSSEVNGIDRVDNSKDYTQDNCVPCCSACNRMKFIYNVDFFISHVLKIAAKQKK